MTSDRIALYVTEVVAPTSHLFNFSAESIIDDISGISTAEQAVSPIAPPNAHISRAAVGMAHSMLSHILLSAHPSWRAQRGTACHSVSQRVTASRAYSAERVRNTHTQAIQYIIMGL